MTERRDSEELEAEAGALLRALRADEDMPPATQARVWRRIERSAAGPRGHVRKAMSPGAWSVVVLAAAAALLLASRAGVLGPLVAERGGEAARYSKDEAAPAPVIPRAAPPVRATATTVEAVPEDRDVQASEPAPARAERVKEARARARVEEPAVKEPPEQEAKNSLAEEAALLARAQAAIQGGRAEAAIEELAGYARRFPGGTLREEHDALRAIALCEAGRTREGRDEAEAFVRERAGSALAERVRGACLAGE